MKKINYMICLFVIIGVFGISSISHAAQSRPHYKAAKTALQTAKKQLMKAAPSPHKGPAIQKVDGAISDINKAL